MVITQCMVVVSILLLYSHLFISRVKSDADFIIFWRRAGKEIDQEVEWLGQGHADNELIKASLELEISLCEENAENLWWQLDQDENWYLPSVDCEFRMKTLFMEKEQVKMPFHGGMPLELQSKPLPLSQAKRSCCLSIGGFGLYEERTPDLGMVPDFSLVVLKLWLLISFQPYFMNPVGGTCSQFSAWFPHLINSRLM